MRKTKPYLQGQKMHAALAHVGMIVIPNDRAASIAPL
jgi:hypothetical protein